jgi:hypothetical protein
MTIFAHVATGGERDRLPIRRVLFLCEAFDFSRQYFHCPRGFIRWCRKIESTGNRIIHCAPTLSNSPATMTLFDIRTSESLFAGIASLFDDLHFNTDPSKANLVLSRVIADLAPLHGTEVRKTIDREFTRATALARRIEFNRDKIGSHNDLVTNLQIEQHYRTGAPYPAKRITVRRILKIMASLNTITDAIVAHNRPSEPTWYDSDLQIERFFDILADGIPRAKGAEPQKP